MKKAISLRRLRCAYGFCVALCFWSIGTLALGQTTTWNNPSIDSDFNNPANWSNGVPNSPSTVAVFGVSNNTSINQQSHTLTFSAFQFNANAPAYSFNINGGTIAGSTYNASNAGNAVFNDNAGYTFFRNQASAANATINNEVGELAFNGQATAGNATITSTAFFGFFRSLKRRLSQHHQQWVHGVCE